MKTISRIILGAALFCAFTTIFIAVLAFYLISNFNVDKLDHSIAIAMDPSASVQTLRDTVEHLGQIAHGALQATKGALELAFSIGIISTALFSLIYVKLKARQSRPD